MTVFGPFRIDTQSRQLYRDDQPLKIEKIPLDILLLLIRERERVVSRDEIAEEVWGRDRFVEAADGINTAIRKIRRALDDDAGEPRYIQTLVGRGYRFLAEVEPEELAAISVPETVPEAPPDPASVQHRFSRLRLIAAAACLLLLPATIWFLAPRLGSARGSATFSSLVRLTSDLGYTGWPDLSADGKLVAYASNRADPDNLDIYIQPAEGSEAIRLTRNSAADIEPVISPKGDQIAFTSYREPVGIYVVPLLGGEERLLVAGGFRPRYSPDGASIAFFKSPYDGGAMRNDRAPNWSSWIMPATGGEPKPLHAGMELGNPTWAGNDHLILTGNKPGAPSDWWLTPRDGSWIRQLGVYEALKNNIPDISPAWSTWTPSHIDRDGAVFSARTPDGANLWRIRFSKDWQPVFPPERVTTMGDFVRNPTFSSNGRLATAIMARNVDVFQLPLDTNTATVKAAARRVTRAKTAEQFVSISADGNLVAYTSWRKGGPGDLFLLDQRTGVERQVTTGPEWNSATFLSPDGRFLFHNWSLGKEKQGARRISLESGTSIDLCSLCGFKDLTADGKSFLYQDLTNGQLAVRDIGSAGPATQPVQDKAPLTSPALDAANRWIAFVPLPAADGVFRIFAAPFRRDARLARKDWVEITTGLTPLWSPNGQWLYFDDKHGLFRCIYGRRFDPVAGKPVGDRVDIAHIHGDQHLTFGPSIRDRALTRDRLLFSVSETTSNIWLMR